MTGTRHTQKAIMIFCLDFSPLQVQLFWAKLQSDRARKQQQPCLIHVPNILWIALDELWQTFIFRSLPVHHPVSPQILFCLTENLFFHVSSHPTNPLNLLLQSFFNKLWSPNGNIFTSCKFKTFIESTIYL